MKNHILPWAVVLYLLFQIVQLVISINPIITRGNMLFDSVTKERFYVKGIDYAPDVYGNIAEGGTTDRSSTGEDHISNDKKELWMKDIPYLTNLGINAVRIYDVDPALEHDLFMNELAKHGIYALISATTSKGPGVLNAAKPSPDCYNNHLLQSAKKIAKAFSAFTNTLGLVVGNEIANAVAVEGEDGVVKGLLSIPCVKALTRDLRTWMNDCACTMRYLPLIYAATDFASTKEIPGYGKIHIRLTISEYLTCDSDGIDVYGINIYTWCSRLSTFSARSTYKKITEQYSSYNIPVMLTEYGCADNDFRSRYPFTTNQRTWKQVETILSTDMSDVFSGCFAYQYSMTQNNFGILLLPNYKANQPDIVSLESYDALSVEYKNTNPPSLIGTWSENNFCDWIPQTLSTKSSPTCPTAWVVQALFNDSRIYNHKQNWIDVPLPPTPDDSYVECPQSTVNSLIKKNNQCKGGECICEEIIQNPSCNINGMIPTDTTNQDSANQYQELFDQQCSLLVQFGGSKGIAACQKISEKGKYGNCPREQKANYILDVWYNLKFETECCANYAIGGGCEEFSYCSYLETESKLDCKVGWTDRTADEEKQVFFSGMCGLIASSTTFNNACDEINQRYSTCSSIQKANYLLKRWLVDINGEKEGYCCSKFGQQETDISSCSHGVDESCNLIPINPLCNISPESGGPTELLFQEQCAYLHMYGGDYKDACSDINGNGKIAHCSNIQKANYILNIWSSNVKHNTECCSKVSHDHGCESIKTDCARVNPNELCMLQSSTSDEDAKKVIDSQCEYFHKSDTPLKGTCANIEEYGAFETCSLIDKANYVLGVWFENVMKRSECCSNLATSSSCKQLQIPLTITEQPEASIALNVGSKVELSIVAVGGVQPYTYQWLKNDANIENAVTDKYIVQKVEVRDSGTYACVVKDGNDNSLLSNPTVLTVDEKGSKEPAKKEATQSFIIILIAVVVLSVGLVIMGRLFWKRKLTDEESQLRQPLNADYTDTGNVSLGNWTP